MKKKLLFLSFVILFGFTPKVSFGKYGGGNGTADEPYLISTGSHLQTLGGNQEDWNSHFKMLSNINLASYTGTSFNIIGNSLEEFAGVFDGNGHRIYNFSYSTNLGYRNIAIFGVVKGTVKNLISVNPNINCPEAFYVGGLVGKLEYNGKVIECASINGNIIGKYAVGGLIGASETYLSFVPKTINSYSTCSVEGQSYVGGLIGKNMSLIYQCYSTGSVNGVGNVGGLAGCVLGGDYEVIASYWDVDSSGKSTSFGGIGKSTVEMMTELNYVGWGCEGKWKINEGNDYPKFIWENSPGQQMLNSVYWDGNGTNDDPFLISSANELYAIGQTPCQWDKHYKLIADIDLTDYTSWKFSSIGDEDIPFSNVFDGNNHNIINYNHGITYEKKSLFGVVVGDNALIKNITLVSPMVDSGSVGILIKYLESGTVRDCNVVGGRGLMAGLVGTNNSGTIIRCNSSAYVLCGGSSGSGGLVGNSSGLIIDCSVTGSLSVSSSWIAGGLVGYNSGEIINCFATCNLLGGTSALSLGGLVGQNNGSIDTCYATGKMRGYRYIGGLVGVNQRVISNCYATGDVSLVGTLEHRRCLGGLVGRNGGGVIKSSYSNGSVAYSEGESAVGGLVGGKEYTDFGGTVLNSYWDLDSSGRDYSYGGVGLTTAEMMKMESFKGFACDDVWFIDEGNDYPRLDWEGTPGQLITSIWYAGGTGQQGDPYLIADACQLDLIGEIYCDMDKHFKLITDIDLAAPEANDFTSIQEFYGVLDGNDHIIENLTSSSLITIASDTNIHNLGLLNPIIDSSRACLVNIMQGGSINNCYVENGSVTAYNAAGLLVGRCEGGFISDCWATGDAILTGQISRRQYDSTGVGVLVGWSNGNIERCFSLGSASAFERYAGGLVGNNQGTVSNCYSQADVDGELWIGGLIGYNNGDGAILNCYATGDVNGNDYTGGLVGFGGDRYTKCFWDSDVNPDVNGIGNRTDPNVIGETTENMQTESTFTSAGWDFVGETANGTEDIWKMCYDPDYPHLWWEQCPMPMHFTPRMLNPKSKGKWVKAHFILPEGFTVDDVNTNSPAKIVEPFMADSNYMDVFLNEDDLVEIEAAFDRAVFCSNGSMLEDIVVIAQLTTGQYFYGTDTIRILVNNLEYLAVLTSYWLAADCVEPDWCEDSDINQDGAVDFIDFAFFDGCCLEFIQK